MRAALRVVTSVSVVLSLWLVGRPVTALGGPLDKPVKPVKKGKAGDATDPVVVAGAVGWLALCRATREPGVA